MKKISAKQEVPKEKSEVEQYHERAKELVEKGLIKKEDARLVVAEKDPTKAKSLLLTALEKRHKEARKRYLSKASAERQDEIESGLA